MKKVQIELTEEQYERLETLAHQLGMSVPDSVCFAVVNLAVSRALQAGGDWRGVMRRAREVRAEIVG